MECALKQTTNDVMHKRYNNSQTRVLTCYLAAEVLGKVQVRVRAHLDPPVSPSPPGAARQTTAAHTHTRQLYVTDKK